MRQEKLNFSIILRIGMSLLPILFGMTLPAMVWCSFNIAMTFIVFGPISSFVSSLCAICISMFFFSSYGAGAQFHGLMLALEAILCAAACIHTIVHRKEFFSGVVLAAVGFLIPGFASLSHDAGKAGLSIAEYLVGEPMAIIKEQFAVINSQSGNMIEPELFSSLIDIIYDVTMKTVPSMLIIEALFVGYVIMWCVCSKIRVLPIKVDHSFSKIKAPRLMICVLLLMLAVLFAGVPQEAEYIILNIAVVLFYICSFAGLSLAEFWLRKVVKNSFVRIMLHLLVIMSFSVVLPMVYALAAVIDAFADFRKVGKRWKTDETEER